MQGHFDPVLPDARIPSYYPPSVNRELRLPLNYTNVDLFPGDLKN